MFLWPCTTNKVLSHELDSDKQYLTMVEEVNLFEDPGPAVSRHLVNDLDRVLHLGVDVDTSLHRCVCTLAKNLPGQSVDLLYKHCWATMWYIVFQNLTWNVLDASDVELAVFFFFFRLVLASSLRAAMAAARSYSSAEILTNCRKCQKKEATNNISQHPGTVYNLDKMYFKRISRSTFLSSSFPPKSDIQIPILPKMVADNTILQTIWRNP